MNEISKDELIQLAKSYEDEVKRIELQLKFEKYLHALITSELEKSEVSNG